MAYLLCIVTTDCMMEWEWDDDFTRDTEILTIEARQSTNGPGNIYVVKSSTEVKPDWCYAAAAAGDDDHDGTVNNQF